MDTQSGCARPEAPALDTPGSLCEGAWLKGLLCMVDHALGLFFLILYNIGWWGKKKCIESPDRTFQVSAEIIRHPHKEKKKEKKSLLPEWNHMVRK